MGIISGVVSKGGMVSNIKATTLTNTTDKTLSTDNINLLKTMTNGTTVSVTGGTISRILRGRNFSGFSLRRVLVSNTVKTVTKTINNSNVDGAMGLNALGEGLAGGVFSNSIRAT